MRAILVDPARHVLEPATLPDPTPGQRQLLVQVRAGALNRADLATRAGTHVVGSGPAAQPFVAGAELAGTVVEAGPGTDRWRPGDAVMAQGPGYAELAVVDEELAMPVPAGLSWEEAGALPVALLTMHDAIASKGRLAAGEAVLVQAATSGVGTVGVALAAHLGAGLVLATSRSPAKFAALHDHLGTLPCPVVDVDTSVPDFAPAVLEATGGRGADVIVDNVGAAVLAGNVEAAALRARIVQVGRLGGRTAELDLDELARKQVSLIGVTFRTRTAAERVEIVRRCLEDVGDHLERYRPRIERTFRLDEAAAAQDALATNAHVGKLVLVP
ncbi:MAG: zinc-binding dehydrogenase [bacterium]|jgi:NADPH2:quinone reductase|nr:zinc-binding dehydrogenase [bacterium]